MRKIYLYNDNDEHYVSVTPLTKTTEFVNERDHRMLKKQIIHDEVL